MDAFADGLETLLPAVSDLSDDDLMPLSAPVEIAISDDEQMLDDAQLEFGLASLGDPTLGARAKSLPKQSAIDRKLKSVEVAWDKAVALRDGDQLHLTGGPSSSRHPNTWNPTGYMREGFCEVGAGGSRRRGDLSHTTRELDILTSLARIAQLLVQRRMSDARNCIQRNL